MIPTGNDLARHSALLRQLIQGILHLDMQQRSQFIGEVSARGTMNESFRGGQQGAEAREPGVCMRPQSVIVKAGDIAQGIVAAAMGIAGEVIERPEFAEDGDIHRGAESLFQFVQGGDLVAQQKHAQSIGAEREGAHNVRVPTDIKLSCRNYNKSTTTQGPRPSSAAKDIFTAAESYRAVSRKLEIPLQSAFR
jgi:hypothetical protein